ERVAALFQQPSRGLRFFAAAIGQIDIGPAREPVLLVPGAFAVTQQDEGDHFESDRIAERPANFALPPSSSSIRSSWLYLQTRSVRLADPVLIWPAPVPTARSAIVASSVSPDRCEMIVPYRASRAILTASRVSVTVPIWFSLTRSALPTPSAMPFLRISGFVTKTSSPTSWTRPPIADVSACQPFQSPSASPSSIETMGYCRIQSS